MNQILQATTIFFRWAIELGEPLTANPGSQVNKPVNAEYPTDALGWQAWAEAPAVIPSGGIEGLLEGIFRRETGLDPDTADYEELMVGYTWIDNFKTDHEEPDFDRGLDLINQLRARYGIFEVKVSLAAKDLTTDRLARIPGIVGIHVLKTAIGQNN